MGPECSLSTFTTLHSHLAAFQWAHLSQQVGMTMSSNICVSNQTLEDPHLLHTQENGG